MSQNTKKMTSLATIAAMAFVLMLVARVPVVLFLKYDPKDIVIALGGLIWGPLEAMAVSVVVSLLELTVSETGLWGLLMNVVSTCSFACTAALVYKRRRTLSGAVLGLGLGCVAMVVLMMFWDWLVVPIYMGVSRETVMDLLIPAFLPFNVIKASLNATFTFLLYKPVITSLRKLGIVSGHSEDAKASGQAVRKPVALWTVCGVIVTVCILAILKLNHVL